LPNLFSLECWGGATFDVAMRFLNEDPWERLAAVREGAPNILTQMLLRGSNGVGYTNYPDNVVKFFVRQAAQGGVDVFRIFDCLNWVENMRVSIDAVAEADKVAEGAICYTGDLLDPDRSKYDLKYYVGLAKELEAAGAHVLGIKDMAGLLKPAAARKLVETLKQEVGLPIHLHTHDTSGAAAATIMAAVDAGGDAFDAAMDALSGTTSQPTLGSLVAALKDGPRDPQLDGKVIREISFYWEAVRTQYRAFESDLKGGASEVYLHEMPGGQFTNLKEQARSLGLESRWHEVAQTYADVNKMFGDIVKVTPSSKVVGDMALAMVSAGLTRADVEDPSRDIAFPDSVVGFFAGDLGQPPGGFPQKLQKKVLKGRTPLTERPGSYLEPIDLEAKRAEIAKEAGEAIDDKRLASYLMYPKVFSDFLKTQDKYGPTEVLPTPVYFYGLEEGEEVFVDIEKGKTLVLAYQGHTETNEKGEVRVFFDLNGQPRTITVPDRLKVGEVKVRAKAAIGDARQVGAPMPGVISGLGVKVGDKVFAGDVLLSIEAMKMETAIHAEADGVVAEVTVKPGDQIDAKDLLVRFE
ncbi:MAG: pyruvate carboxylase subunit B, partial [Devosia sp.]